MRTFSGERRRNRDGGSPDPAGFKRRWSDAKDSARSE